jgi:protein gp37
MSDNTKIEWSGRTWNPILGCDRLSPGCDRCYAITQARIRAGNPNPKVAEAFAGLTLRTDSGIDWTGQVNLLPDRLMQPLAWRKPETVFVNSLSDLFHKNVPDDFILQVFAVMAVTPRHTYQVLTKRHGRMRSLLNREDFAADVHALAVQLDGHTARRRDWPLPNVHLGVSVEDQKRADLRIPALIGTPAAVRWLSCEPLLGEVMLHELYNHLPWSNTEFGTLCACGAAITRDSVHCHGDAIGWVVAGGESGPGARPCDLEWLRSLKEQCAETGTAFFAKQLGSVLGKQLGAGSKGGDMDAWPEDLRVREFPRGSCRTCDGSGVLTVPDTDGESASEQACADPSHGGGKDFGALLAASSLGSGQAVAIRAQAPAAALEHARRVLDGEESAR